MGQGASGKQQWLAGPHKGHAVSSTGQVRNKKQTKAAEKSSCTQTTEQDVLHPLPQSITKRINYRG